MSSRRSWLAGAAAVAAVGVLAWLWPHQGSFSGTADLRIRLVLGVAALGIAPLARLAWMRRRPALRSGALALLVALGVAAFTNLGVFRHAPRYGFLNEHELFHYQLGSKYFPELGHDGLYAASLAAQYETEPSRPLGERVRDLRSNELVPVTQHGPFVREVVARFRPERWRAFVSDHAYYLRANPPAVLNAMRIDHGYNPTPAWTFVARLFDARLPTNRVTLTWLGSLDLVLLAVAVGFVFRTFGAWAGALTVVLLGLGYGWRALYVGALLRLDWLAATIVGVCMLERQRPRAAGALFGYAAAVRLFPVLLLLGPAVVAIRKWLAGRRPRWPFQLAGAFVLVVALGFVAGGLAGRGFGAWPESVRNLTAHRELWPPNRVGLDQAVVNGARLVESLRGGPARLGPSPRRSADLLRIERTARPWLLGLKGFGLALLVAAWWQASPARAALLGLVAVFVLVPLGSYYWVLLAALPLTRTAGPALFALALGTALYGFHLLRPEDAQMETRFTLMSLGLGILFLGWLLPDALRTLRSAARRAPAPPPR